MRLLSFLPPGSTTVHVGALAPDGVRVVDLTAIGVEDMLDAVGRAAALRRVASHLLHAEGAVAWRRGEVRLLAPLPGARAAHLVTRGALPVAGAPALRFDDPMPVLGDGAQVTRRADDRWVACLAVVVGAEGQGVDAAEGERMVAGVAIAARWLADEELATPVLQLGPWITGMALLADRRTPEGGFALATRALAGGAEVARGSLEALAVAPGALVAAAASRHTVRVGDVLTQPLRAADGAWLAVAPAEGEEVGFEIERLGALTMRAAAGTRQVVRQTVSIGE